MTERKNPWANIKAEASKVVPPVTVVRDHARMLTDSTEGIVQGFVETVTSGSNVIHHLQCVVPALDNYTVTIAFVTHGPLLYPANADRPSRREPPVVCATHEDLYGALELLLTEQDPQRIVISLVAQATAPDRS